MNPRTVPGGPTGARLPATYTIGKGDSLNPPLVNAPSFIAVQLTLISGDGQAHTAVVRTSPPHTLHVPAGGRVSLLLRGLKDGRYVIDLDGGKGGGSLLVGGEPGP